MKVILTSVGSMGDIQPLLALSQELQSHGHAVTFAAPPNYAKYAARLGITYKRIGPELSPTFIKNLGNDIIQESDPRAQVQRFLTSSCPLIPQMYKELRQISRGADVLVSVPFQFAGRMVCDSFNIRYVSIHMSQFGSLGSKGLRELSRPMINGYRRKEGLSDLDDPFGEDAASPELAIYAVSKTLMFRSSRWPEHHHAVGFFYVDEKWWEPGADLMDFLDAGERPIVVSFGSMPHENPDRISRLLVEAIAACGKRAIIQRGWSGLGEHIHTPNILWADFVPHNWLFGKAACVVHHGGAGTIAAALKAGVPSVIVPHTLDQPIWAEMIRGLHCAGGVIPLNALTADKLALAIEHTVTNPRYSQAAQVLQAKILQETGVADARLLIEDLVVARRTRTETRIV